MVPCSKSAQTIATAKNNPMQTKVSHSTKASAGQNGAQICEAWYCHGTRKCTGPVGHKFSHEEVSRAPSDRRILPLLRCLPVRDLTMDECQHLKVHSHSHSNERRNAYLFKSTETPEIYFSEKSISGIRKWLEAEASNL